MVIYSNDSFELRTAHGVCNANYILWSKVYSMSGDLSFLHEVARSFNLSKKVLKPFSNDEVAKIKQVVKSTVIVPRMKQAYVQQDKKQKGCSYAN